MIWYIITLGNEGFIFILFLFLLQLNGCLHTGFPAFQTFKHFIGVGRFRILGGGQGLVYWGGKGGQIPSRHMTSFRRHVPNRFLINQCQIITFLILKYDIKNSRIELRGIVLPVQVDALLGGGGGGGGGGGRRGKGYVGPPSQIIGGALPPPPLFLRLCISVRITLVARLIYSFIVSACTCSRVFYFLILCSLESENNLCTFHMKTFLSSLFCLILSWHV